MQTATPEFAQLKAGMKTSWMAGDFGQIALHTVHGAEKFVERIAIRPEFRVLDVACGTGNTTLPAARTGASVTGVDIAPNLLAQARQRAASEGLEVRFDEGDAEDLPYPDQAFDVILTMFGAMFAPRPDVVAAELMRVCKPGGLIAMANWTPEGFVGKTFQATAKMAPPPPGVPPPVLWGTEQAVRQRFAHGISSLSLTRQRMEFSYPLAPEEMVRFFRQYFGPTQMAFARLDRAGQTALAAQLEALWNQYNIAIDGSTRIASEYLDVRAIRA